MLPPRVFGNHKKNQIWGGAAMTR